MLKNSVSVLQFSGDLHAISTSAIELCRKTYKPEECKDAAYHLRLVVALSDNPMKEVLR